MSRNLTGQWHHSPVYGVGDHLLVLLPHGAPEGGVPLPVPGLGVRPVVQLTHPRRADQSRLSPGEMKKLIIVF